MTLVNLKIPKLVKTGFFFTLSQGVVAGVNLLVVLIFTPKLGPEGFGEISLIWMVALFASLFVDSRLNTAFSLRFYKLNISERREFVSAIYLYYILTSFLLYILPFNILIGKVLKIEISSYQWLTIVVLVFAYVFSTFYTNFLVLTHKGTEYFVSKVIWSLIFLLSALYFTTTRDVRPYDYLISLIVSYGFIAVVGLFRINVSLPRFEKKKKFIRTLHSLLIVSSPLIIEGIITMLLAWSDRFMVQYFSGLTLLGIYAFSYRFSDAVNSLVLNPIGQVLSPSLLKIYNTDKQKFQIFYGKISSLYLLIAISVGLIFQMILRIIFKYFISDEFYLSSQIIDLFIIGALVLGFGNLLAFNFLASEKTKKLLFLNIVTLFCSFILGGTLTYLFSIYGAGIAMILTYVVFCILLYKNQLQVLDLSLLFQRNKIPVTLFIFLYTLSFFINYLNIYNYLALFINILFVLPLLIFIFKKMKIIFNDLSTEFNIAVG